MAKIYVSSTFLDLQEHREQVRIALRSVGHEDAAMEYYTAGEKRPLNKCLDDVTTCDIYVGIFAWRYGYIPKGQKKSVTEQEYRTAIKLGKPCLIFILKDDAPWPVNRIEVKQINKINKLRKELTDKHQAGMFTDKNDLAKQVTASIYNWALEHGHISTTSTTIPEHNLDTYYEALRKRFGVLALEGLTPPQKEEYLQIQLRQVFVEQNVRENPPPIELPKEIWEKLSRDKEIHTEDLPSGITLGDARKARASYYEKPSRPVLEVLTDPSYKYTIILGDPGSGKSTLARYVMLSLIDISGDEKLHRAFDGYLPLLIELRSYAGSCADSTCATFLEYLEYLGKTEGWALTQAALHNHLKNDGSVVVIFDGLDEIFEPEQREQITRQVVGFCNDYPKVRVIVTSRVIGYRRKILTDAGFTHFTLQDLDEKQVETFITHWYDLAMSDRPDEAKERHERILKSFKDSASIRQLAGNPMLLTIMAIIGKHQELPRERWKLYDHATSVLIQHWDVNKHLKNESIEADFIGEDDKKELLRRLAFRMQGGEGGLTGNYIHRDSLQIEFESYLLERYNQTLERAKLIAEAMILQFRERNFILSLYGASLYGFVHRAFLEYFCASAFVHKFEKTKELTIDQLKVEIYKNHWEDENWHEVLRLICGMINEIWASAIISFLINEVYRPWPEEFSNRIPRNITLAIQCLGEIRNLSILGDHIEALLRTICELFEHELSRDRIDIWWFLESNIIPSMESTTLNWANKEPISELLLRLKPRLSAYWNTNAFASFIAITSRGAIDIHEVIVDFSKHYNMNTRVLVPKTLARIWRDNPDTIQIIHELMTKDTTSIGLDRAVAAESLAMYFHDNKQTWPLLQERAIQDPDAFTRAAILEASAEYYFTNAEAFSFLCERIANDQSAEVRSNTIRTLARYFNNNPNTLSLLLGWIMKSDLSDIRSSAISSLAEYFRSDTQTLSLVRDRAINDSDAGVRSSATSSLVAYFPDDVQTLPLVRDRAINDPEAGVRSSAIKSLAEYFRGDAQTLSLVRDRVINDSEADVRSSAIRSLAEYFRGDAQTLSLVRDRAINDPEAGVRSSAIRSLAEYFRGDAHTLSLMRDRAINDSEAGVRSSTIHSLAEHFRSDTHTLSLVRDRAINDSEASVRSSAISSLAEYFHDDTQTLLLLRGCALKDEDGDVRGTALNALAKLYRDDPETLLLLRECAVKDKDASARSSAISALAEYYRDNPETLPLLLDRATNDLSPVINDPNDEYYPREVAINAIAENWSEHPDTRLLLRERAENDPNPWLRERAKELIVEIEDMKKQKSV